MSVEVHDKMIKLLSSVEEFKQKEIELKGEKQRHQEQTAASEGEVRRCDEELGDIRENQLRLRREMDGLRDDLFLRARKSSYRTLHTSSRTGPHLPVRTRESELGTKGSAN
jgi:hypothetical protein